MFGWINTIIGYLLSPIFSALYNTLVLGALQILNLTFQTFEYFAGANTSELLFNTTLVDGSPQLNFFQSDSVLRPVFITLLTFSFSLLVILIPLNIFGATTSIEKRERIQRVKHLVGSATGIFAVPLAFLTILSLFGALINVLSGERIAMSNNDITIFQSNLKQSS